MPRSRTIITLSALLAAMTIGTFALLALETNPAQPTPFAALAARAIPSPLEQNIATAVVPVDASLQVGRWTSIVVHDIAGPAAGPCAAASHFYVGAPDQSGNCTVSASTLWSQQAPGAILFIPDQSFNAGAISICVAGDFGTAAPSPQQMSAALKLIGTLQARLGIGADHVYLHRDLSGQPCPGPAFPVEEFRRGLR
jgi:hypothetical protein